MPSLTKIAPCLWFNDQAEEAAALYTAVFPNSRTLRIARYGEAGFEFHGKPAGSVLTVSFELDGQAFTALNGGPAFQISEAISFQIMCDTQEDVDYYWDRLGVGGGGIEQQCGWIKDRFGVSWQVVPSIVPELLDDSDPARAQRVMAAVFNMTKLVIADLERAAAG